MTLRNLLVPFLAAVALLAWAGRSFQFAHAAGEDQKLEGVWSLWRSIQSGKTTADSGEGMIVEGNTLQLTLRGKPLAEKGTYTLKADANPKQIDFEHTFGRYKGQKQLGIYRFTGPGQLEISWGEPGSNKRPTKFTGKLALGAGTPLNIYRASDYKLPEAVAKELKDLEGKWKITVYHRFGRAEPMAAKRGEGFLLEGEDVQYFWGGSNKGGKAQYMVDPTAKPKQIEFVYTVGQERYHNRIGIYKLQGDKLEISLSDIDSEKRPTAFTGIKGTPGAGEQYFVCERE